MISTEEKQKSYYILWNELSQATFLDVRVILDKSKLICDLYTKPMDSHLCLGRSSCHSFHTKKTLLYSSALRVRRICTYEYVCTLVLTLNNMSGRVVAELILSN